MTFARSNVYMQTLRPFFGTANFDFETASGFPAALAAVSRASF
jgi:hypothetical protein